MDKVAVYAGTRNLYEQMYVCLKSLLANTNMDRVYLFIEDDEFPYPVPENVHPMNVSEQDYFHEGSPNYKSPWSYMTMLRCALSMMLPDEKQILWLDCDTIVNEDISDLFDIDMNGYFYAGVLEPAKSKDIFRYINTGVLMCNLDLIRGLHKDYELVSFLNVCKFGWVDQDCINMLCQGRIRIIDSVYNANPFTMPTHRPKIIHYAANKDFKNEWAYKVYEELDMSEIEHKKTE